MTRNQIRRSILKSAAKNIIEFGYPDATPENILGDYIFCKLFKGMLEDESNVTGNQTLEAVRLELLSEVNARIDQGYDGNGQE